jgi:UDP-N-acetylmuramoylalanine--D-glutamate ligase
MAPAAARRLEPLAERSFLVYGLGITGRAVVESLAGRGLAVVAVDDAPTEAARARCAELGVELVVTPDAARLAEVVAEVEAVLPTPGLPETHPLYDTARRAGRPVLSELDLAGAWDTRPVVAITGTNGKTTVTTLVTAMLVESGLTAVDAGNTPTPLVAALEEPLVDVFVVEASSFRLGHSRHFAPDVGVWLNFAPDHLDVHADLAGYEAAKARIWRDQRPDQVAVANLEDPVVMAHATGPARLVTFGPGGDYRVEGERLVGPGGPIAEIGRLWRSLPHDLSNALAAAAAAEAAGAATSAVAAALEGFEGLAHRVSRVGERDGVVWFDDSKATTPHAVAAAVSGFGSVVLVAGGRNKGVDLAVLGRLAPPVRAVVGIGEAGPDVVAALADVPGVVATSMEEAVASAARLAQPGDAVLLSPGCASFDWYGGYAERGDDFARVVRQVVLEGGGAAGASDRVGSDEASPEATPTGREGGWV